MEYYSAFKKNKILIQCYNMDEPSNHAKGNKAGTEGQMFYDCT